MRGEGNECRCVHEEVVDLEIQSVNEWAGGCPLVGGCDDGTASICQGGPDLFWDSNGFTAQSRSRQSNRSTLQSINI